MPTKIRWSQDPDGEPGDLIGETIYSQTPKAIASRERRARLGLKHTVHSPRNDVCSVCKQPWPCPTPWKQGEVPWELPKPRPRPVPVETAIDARDFLRDWLSDQIDFGEGEEAWFAALSEYLESLEPADTRVQEIAFYLLPVLEDEDGRIDGIIYPNGATVRYVLESPWGGDMDEYLAGFTKALADDYFLWVNLLWRFGSQAYWPAEGATLATVRSRRQTE